jgi:hypothetical protein
MKRTNKQTPLLEEVRIMLEAAIFHIEENSTEDAHELVRDALANVYESIHQIQGAREDAHRMAGRVALDTGLLDMLAPNEESPRFEEILDLCPALRTAYYRFAKLDANGACCVFNDVQEAYQDGVFDSMCERLASELNAASDSLESGVN